MVAIFAKLIILTALFGSAALVACAQQDLPDASTRSSRQRKEDVPAGLKEMLAKQKAERDKKEHEEMLARGEEALRLANQLETSFEQNKGFSQQDKGRLESLEKVVIKIRKELGGDDDGDGDSTSYLQSDEDDPKPSNMEEAFRYLQTTTVKLVDELKKTTRFSISALAIQSSNTVLKLVRFLRIKK
jgi:hypothetical protein